MTNIKKEALISIVVPIYNSKNTIRVCMESLMAQSYKNIQIVVVDDGSDDGTIEICRCYAKQDSRIEVHELGHGGVSKARNAGIKFSKGQYITFVDSDDYVEKNLIQRYVDAGTYFESQKQQIAWILCGMHVDVHCGTMKDENKLLHSEESFVVEQRSSVAYLSWLKLFNFITNKLYNLDKIKEHKICFDDQIQNAEDLKFNLDYLQCVEGVFGVVNEPLYHYVRHSDESLSLRYYHNAIEHTKDIYQELLAFAQKQVGITENDMAVIKSIYLVDWTSRLTALYIDKQLDIPRNEKKKKIKKEVCSEEFQELLEEVFRHGKISLLRYRVLRMKNYTLYIFLRKIYRWWKSIA